MEKDKIVKLIQCATSKDDKSEGEKYFRSDIATKVTEKLNEFKKEVAAEMFPLKKK